VLHDLEVSDATSCTIRDEGCKWFTFAFRQQTAFARTCKRQVPLTLAPSTYLTQTVSHKPPPGAPAGSGCRRPWTAWRGRPPGGRWWAPWWGLQGKEWRRVSDSLVGTAGRECSTWGSQQCCCLLPRQPAGRHAAQMHCLQQSSALPGCPGHSPPLPRMPTAVHPLAAQRNPAAHPQTPSWAGRCPCPPASCQPQHRAGGARSPAAVQRAGELVNKNPLAAHAAPARVLQPLGNSPICPAGTTLNTSAVHTQHFNPSTLPPPRTRVSAVAASSRLARCMSASACLGCPSCSYALARRTCEQWKCSKHCQQQKQVSSMCVQPVVPRESQLCLKHAHEQRGAPVG